MIAILKQDGINPNRIVLFSKDGCNLGSCSPDSFKQMQGQEMLDKIWKDKRVEIEGEDAPC